MAGFNAAKGRIAETMKDYVSLDIPKGSWSVVTSDGFQYQTEALTRQGTQPKARCAEVLFYASKADAYEESAYLVGKRVGQAVQVRQARRARSLAGAPKWIDLHTLGRIGIGCVAGVVNTAGTRLGMYNDDDGPDPGPQQAVLAVEALKPTFKDMFTSAFTVVDGEGALTLCHAKVLSDDGETVEVQTYKPGGTLSDLAAVVRVDHRFAAHSFGRPMDVLGGVVSGNVWPRLQKLVDAVRVGQPGARVSGQPGGNIPLRPLVRLLAACEVAPAADIAQLHSVDGAQLNEFLSGWMGELESQLETLSSHAGGADGASVDGADRLLQLARDSISPGAQLT